MRRNWKYAAICQFLITFDEALQLDGFTTQALEDALDRMQMSYLDALFFKLLHALTQDRHLTEENWGASLRTQWNRRAADDTPPVLGTDEEPVEWTALTLDQQLDTLHALCEWQLEYPDRLRRLVATDEDAISWRVDPAGWDREGNTYWLFDDNRLWVQRVPKRAPKRKAAKQPKRPAKKKAAPPPRPSGRRSSRLSKGADAEWEEVPPEILKPEDVFDSDSELSQPPSEDESEWVEFETLCVSLQEWKAFLEKFASLKHPDERVLYSYLAKEVFPRVEEVLVAEQRKQALEEAMSHRKRSSRIAMKESEREVKERELAEARAARVRAVAELREREEREAREQAETNTRRSREERLRDREERLLARERMAIERSRSDTPADRSESAQERKDTQATNASSDWFLHCEVCGEDAKNPQNADNVVACERCGVWQHTECWDRKDKERGQPPRDWDKVDFYCGACREHSSYYQSNQVYATRPQPMGASHMDSSSNMPVQDRLLMFMSTRQPVATSAPLTPSYMADYHGSAASHNTFFAPSLATEPPGRHFMGLPQLHSQPVIPNGAMPSRPPNMPLMSPVALLRRGHGDTNELPQHRHAPLLAQYAQEPGGVRRMQPNEDSASEATGATSEPAASDNTASGRTAPDAPPRDAPRAGAAAPVLPVSMGAPLSLPSHAHEGAQRSPPVDAHLQAMTTTSPKRAAPARSPNRSPSGSFPLRRNTLPSPLSRAISPAGSVPPMQLDTPADALGSAPSAPHTTV